MKQDSPAGEEGASQLGSAQQLRPEKAGRSQRVGITFAPQAEHYLTKFKLQGKYVQFDSEQSRINRF